MAKLDEDPNKLAEIADVLLMIHQCERCSYRYMDHVMLAAQLVHHVKLATVQMDSTTAWCLTSNQSSLQMGSMREKETSSMAKKGCYGVGSWLYIKPEIEEEAMGTEVQNQLYGEIDYTSDKEQLQQLMKNKLMHDSGKFHSGARQLKSKLWWQNTKLWIILIIIVLVILLIVGASIAIPLGLKYGKKS
ncbi:hypothetical protein EMCRGX_G017334 [Ephydatia muelleri]